MLLTRVHYGTPTKQNYTNATLGTLPFVKRKWAIHAVTAGLKPGHRRGLSYAGIGVDAETAPMNKRILSILEGEP
jgi:hypothetical protein